MRYSDDIIEEVRMKNDIVDVVSQYVKLNKRGSTYFGLCPFHNEKTPSFSVTPAKQMYYCFGCGAGGNVFNFVMEYENYTFGEALKHLADRAGVQLPKIEYSGEAKKKAERRAALLEINKLAAGYFYYQLRRESGRQAHEYLTGRGLSEETIRKFGLGYSDKYSDDLYKYLKSKNYSDELLRDSGLFNVDERRGMYDKFWNRVIFPIMDVNNRVIGFGGRVMGDGKPKYLNSPETTIFDKSRNLYGLNVARTTRKNYLILCEGYMDVISMHQAGFTNAVASLGTALTSGHASLLKRYTQEVLLLYDSDDAGVRAALRAIPILREAGVSSRVVNLKPHKDPDEFIKALGAEEFEKRLEQAMDSFMFRIHMAEREFPMEEPQGQNRFFERCAQMLLELSDELERNLYIEAIVKDYRSSGISVENLKKRVGALAMKGTPAEQRIQPKPVGAGQQKKKESAAEKAQKLMLTWLVTYPGIFDTVEKYIQPSDFVVPLYRQVAEMLYQQHRDGDVNPARLMNAFIDSEEQREVSSLFNATIHLETPEEQNRAFSDAVIRIKDESLKERNRTWDPTDIQGLQELVKAKKELEEARKALTEKAEQQKPDPTPTPTPNPNPAPDTVKTVPKKGTVFTDGKGISYKVTKSDAKKGTVAVTGTRKKRNKITIPATVTKDGYTFKVTEIAAKAFQNNKKLTTLVLGTNISKIGTKSFYKNSKLKSITFKNKNAVKIGSQAFKGIKATAKVTVPKKMTAKNFGKLKKAMKSAGKKVKYKKK